MKKTQTKRVYAKPSKKATNANIKKVVKNIVDADLEIKRQERSTIYNNIQTFITDARIVSLTPIIAQGTGQGDRVGNTIKLKKAMLMVNIALDSAALAAGYPHYIDVYIFKFKKNNFTQPSAVDMTKFLQLGNSAISYNGDSFAGLRELNVDLFTQKLRKRFSMIHAFTVNNSNGYGPMLSNRTMKIDITKYLKSVIHFDDSASNLTINDNLYIAIGNTQYNQLGVPSDIYIGTYDTCVTYHYTDA